jgi:pimeloyl-ACP methyl ester carboxylesterase
MDVGAIADQLELGHFGVMGVSGGGPYALACAYAFPERLDFCVLMGSWAPVAAEPTLWTAMAPLDRFFGRISQSAPWAFKLPFSIIGLAAKQLRPRGFIRTLETSLCDDDRALLADDALAAFFVEDIQEAFRHGVKGPAEDAILLYGDWGFAASDIQYGVSLYHGTEDKFAPFRYGQYLDRRLPQSRLFGYPGRGHLFVMQLFPILFENLGRS